jgi:hypothetical protein
MAALIPLVRPREELTVLKPHKRVKVVPINQDYVFLAIHGHPGKPAFQSRDLDRDVIV